MSISRKYSFPDFCQSVETFNFLGTLILVKVHSNLSDLLNEVRNILVINTLVNRWISRIEEIIRMPFFVDNSIAIDKSSKELIDGHPFILFLGLDEAG